MTTQILRFPEWKALYDAAGPLLEPGRVFSYEELKELAGVDVRTDHGRHQFQRFRTEVLKTMQLWLESDRNRGYHVVQPNEHAGCANAQLRRARRRMKRGREIVYYTRLDMLTDEQRKVNADVLARLGRLETTAMETQKDIRKLVAGPQSRRLPSPVIEPKAS